VANEPWICPGLWNVTCPDPLNQSAFGNDIRIEVHEITQDLIFSAAGSLGNIVWFRVSIGEPNQLYEISNLPPGLIWLNTTVSGEPGAFIYCTPFQLGTFVVTLKGICSAGTFAGCEIHKNVELICVE
jgi:hypothetical protein